MSKLLAASASLACLAVAGCATSYFYQPSARSSAQANGHPAAYFEIPADKPSGDVRIASFGFTDVQPADGGPKTKALHVRMVLANNQDPAAWTLDTREIVLAFGGAGESRPAFVNTDAGTPPSVKIPPGQKATLDLYYPLPEGMASASKLPAFDVVWRVRTGSGLVVQRTPFERERLEPAYAYPYGYYGYPYFGAAYPYGGFGYFSLGWGPSWWYDPWYPYYGFPHHPGVVRPYGGVSIRVHRGVGYHAGHSHGAAGAQGVGGSGGHRR